MQYGKTLEVNLSKDVNWHLPSFLKYIRILGSYIKCIVFVYVFFNHTKTTVNYLEEYPVFTVYYYYD